MLEKSFSWLNFLNYKFPGLLGMVIFEKTHFILPLAVHSKHYYHID